MDINQLLSNRRAIRGPVSELDKCTIVSIYPKMIREKKLTCVPGYFEIEPGNYDNPALLVVGSSSYFRDVDPEQPYIEIPIPSTVMADSIVKDFCRDVIESDMATMMPGLFFIPGVLTVIEIKLKHKDKLDSARDRQNRWFQQIVMMADVDWARTNGNPLSIPDEARMGAAHLGLKNKAWMQDFQAFEMKNCPACGHLYNPLFPVCGHCKTVVDKKKFDALSLSTAS
jgi:hypothetical protein